MPLHISWELENGVAELRLLAPALSTLDLPTSGPAARSTLPTPRPFSRSTFRPHDIYTFPEKTCSCTFESHLHCYNCLAWSAWWVLHLPLLFALQQHRALRLPLPRRCHSALEFPSQRPPFPRPAAAQESSAGLDASDALFCNRDRDYDVFPLGACVSFLPATTSFLRFFNGILPMAIDIPRLPFRSPCASGMAHGVACLHVPI